MSDEPEVDVKPTDEIETSVIYREECLPVLKRLPRESVDLFIADPPYFTGKNRIWREEIDIRGYEDEKKGGIKTYLLNLGAVLTEALRTLKSTGSLYAFCDEKAKWQIKPMIEGLTVEGKGFTFRREIILAQPEKTGSAGFKGFNPHNWVRGHDTILYFVKSRKGYYFNPQYEQYTEVSKERLVKNKGWGGKDENGIYYTSTGQRNNKKGGRAYIEKAYVTWSESFKNSCKPIDGGHRGPLYLTPSGETVRFAQGYPMLDVWIFNRLDTLPNSGDFHKYRTEKVLGAYDYMIGASCPEGGVVVDPYLGGGTTLVAAARAKCRWIGIDKAVGAVRKTEERLDSENISYTTHGMPTTVEELRTMEPLDFESFVTRNKGGRMATKAENRKGIDFWDSSDDPGQTKRQEVGRDVVDKFRGALDRVGRKKGTIVAFHFSERGDGAVEEAARLVDEGYHITLETVQELLDKKGGKVSFRYQRLSDQYNQ